MCLGNPDSKPTRKWGVGYKVVRKSPERRYHPQFFQRRCGHFPLYEWLTDPNDKLVSTKHDAYRTGFHIMLDRTRAERLAEDGLKLIKVRFRKVVATQTATLDSLWGPQVVAKEIMNLGEVKQ
jgi:hypothetical protein|tara:strand:- start:4795 stop:5163 length:369 start_codon:yes stop_codon:yes gene_type:complete